MSLQVNKIHGVFTIAKVAAEFGVSEEWLSDIAADMEPEDGLIWVYDLNDASVVAFSDFGIENLGELIKIHIEENPENPPKQAD